MRIRNLELWLAFVAIIAITIVYLGFVGFNQVPSSSGLFGHSLGIVGFVLMLMTEILYSLRKRYMAARWGKMQHWLSFHIFTGLVGPYMVLLHSSWKFNGLAGVLTLMTMVIVGSGFVGRYFYTAIPRTTEGEVMEAQQVQQLIAHNQVQIQQIQQNKPELAQKIDQLTQGAGVGWFSSVRNRRRWRELEHSLTGLDRRLVSNLGELMERQLTLQQQSSRSGSARRFLAIWHTIHVPLGVATFTVAFIHIGAVLYYATFSR
jgi:hypothetical protein